MMPTLCPACGARFTAPAEGIIDVGSDPGLKGRFLRGQVNLARCPQCGAEAAMNTPLLYHDPAHELALVLMPVELTLHHNDQQRIIGDLTNALINSLPPEQRKGYLLAPQTFITMQSLIDRVLQAEGITPEMIERQRSRGRLIETFLQAKDEEALRLLVKEHEAALDYEFFQVLTASAQSAHAEGRPELARALMGLRALLAEMSATARAAAAEVNAALGLGESITRDELLNRLKAATNDDEWDALVAAGRPLLDYAFFQNLTAQIEAAPDSDTAGRLRALRSRILDTTARQDEEARVAMQEAANLLKTVLQADNPETVLREHVEEIDDLFFAVVTANLQQAQAGKRSDWVERLRHIADLASSILEEQLPPEIRLLQRLLRAGTPEQWQQLLADHRAHISAEFMNALAGLIQQLEAARQSQAAERLKQIQEHARTLAQGAVLR
jgi:hypothetical protein